MKGEIATRNESQQLKSYSAPEVIVYGDVKKITLNIQQANGDDQLFGEGGAACSSVGNCT